MPALTSELMGYTWKKDYDVPLFNSENIVERIKNAMDTDNYFLQYTQNTTIVP
jgi:hypothetical protein